MAAKPKAAQKIKLDYNIGKEIYDDFVRMTSKKGSAPVVVVERMMKKYVESSGNI